MTHWQYFADPLQYALAAPALLAAVISDANMHYLIEMATGALMAWIAYKSHRNGVGISDNTKKVVAIQDSVNGSAEAAREAARKDLADANARTIELAAVAAASQIAAAFERGKASAKVDLQEATDRAFRHGREASTPAVPPSGPDFTPRTSTPGAEAH